MSVQWYVSIYSAVGGTKVGVGVEIRAMPNQVGGPPARGRSNELSAMRSDQRLDNEDCLILFRP